jgi:phospholipase C
MLRSAYLVGVAFSLLLLQGCGSKVGTPSTPSTPAAPPTNASTIKHIVVIMQENRTVDNLFNGFPGADTVLTATQKGKTVTLQPVALEQGQDVDHSHTAWLVSYDNGLLDNFAHDATLPQNFAYAYVPQSETVPYFTLAKAYTFGDRMFQSNTGPSFVAHQYMIAGQSGNSTENPSATPWGCDAAPGTTVALIGPNGTDVPGVFPCFDYQTVADLLDAKKVTWKYYAPPLGPAGYPLPGAGDVWSAFEAIKHIRYGPDWTNNVISPQTQFFTDIQNGQLAQVTWIVPAFTYSDHAGPTATAEGPDWVADIVNAIGGSQYWDSTVIFISWDDWGGWYDHVVPPQVDNMGYGFRVPLIIVSPYAKHGYVSENVHEFSSFLKYTEETFNLQSLGTRDVSADDLSDCFDYTQTPQPYTPVPVKLSPAYFIAKKDLSPPDND